MRKIFISIVYKEFIDLFIDNFHISIINRIIIKLLIKLERFLEKCN